MSDLFTPKPFAEIVAGMVEHLRASTDRITDYNVGSVVRSLLEANAVELDDYYREVYAGLLRSIPTAIYLGFGFERSPAVRARGAAVFTLAAELLQEQVYPAGLTLTSLSGVEYLTESTATIPAGETSISVAISAALPGAHANAAAHVLTLPSSAFVGVQVDNPSSLSGGVDEESEEQRAERFAAFVRALARGTVAALEYGATLPRITHPVTGEVVEQARRASVHETPGHVDLYIHNGAFGASAELIAAVQREIDGYRDGAAWVGGWRPAGMRVDVQALVETPAAVQMELRRLPGASAQAVSEAARAAVERILRAALPRDLVRPIDLVNAALSADGVLGAVVLAPTQALTVPDDAILYLDDWSVTWPA